MAFTPETISVIAQPIGGLGLRLVSYRSDDAVGTITGTDYFANASRYGLRVGDLIFVSAISGDVDTYIVTIDAVDADGNGTAAASAVGLTLEDIGVTVQAFNTNLTSWAAVEPSDYLETTSIGSTVQAYDAATAKLDVADQVVTGGVRVTSLALGTAGVVSSGTVTLDPGDRALQHYSNNGAHTLAPGANTGSLILDIVNDSSAGAITTSGWTKVSGSFTTTDGHAFRCSCTIGESGSLLQIVAMQ